MRMISICFYAEWNNYFRTAHKGDFFYKLLKKRYIFQLTKYKDVRKRTNSEETNLYSIGCAE